MLEAYIYSFNFPQKNEKTVEAAFKLIIFQWNVFLKHFKMLNQLENHKDVIIALFMTLIISEKKLLLLPKTYNK